MNKYFFASHANFAILANSEQEAIEYCKIHLPSLSKQKMLCEPADTLYYVYAEADSSYDFHGIVGDIGQLCMYVTADSEEEAKKFVLQYWINDWYVSAVENQDDITSTSFDDETLNRIFLAEKSHETWLKNLVWSDLSCEVKDKFTFALTHDRKFALPQH